jgi:hypothetical protein
LRYRCWLFGIRGVLGLIREQNGFAPRRGVVAWCVRAASLAGLVSALSGWLLAAPAAAQPANDNPPSISGTRLQSQPLTEVAGSWSDAAGGVIVQWESCPSSLGSGCTPIPNSPTSQGSQYIPTTSDIGKWITAVETASDGRGNVSSVIADPVGPVKVDLVTATMQWTFYYTPSYTKVMGLTVNGLSSQASVLVRCGGHGCPFSKRVSSASTNQPCGHRHEFKCRSHGTLDLSPALRGNRLRVGTKLTIAITIPGGVGKYYAFTARAGHGPRVFIGCLAPGATRPGAAC